MKTKRKTHRPRVQLDKKTLALKHEQALQNLFFKTLTDVPNKVRAPWLTQLTDGLEVLLVKRGTQRQMVQAYRDVTDCFNLSEQLIKEGYSTGTEYIDAAVDVLIALYHRVKAMGYVDSAWMLTGPQIAALTQGREVFAEQMALTGISGAEWLRAIEHTSKRCSIARTKGNPGDTIDGVLLIDLAMPD